MEDLPIPVVDPLPTRITPCPIIETILEVRFVTAEDWSVIPGLLYPFIREKYPKKEELPLAQVPLDLRRSDPSFTYKALIQFSNEQFLIQVGPRVITLVANSGYPGWSAIKEEMQWLLVVIEKCQFVAEGERIGMRYVDFFPLNLFEHLIAKVQIGETSIHGAEMSLTKVFQRGPLKARLRIDNGVIAKQGDLSVRGSVFDLDVWVDAEDFDLFSDGLERFKESHHLNKEVFFGLMTDDFLKTLNPDYE